MFTDIWAIICLTNHDPCSHSTCWRARRIVGYCSFEMGTVIFDLQKHWRTFRKCPTRRDSSATRRSLRYVALMRRVDCLPFTGVRKGVHPMQLRRSPALRRACQRPLCRQTIVEGRRDPHEGGQGIGDACQGDHGQCATRGNVLVDWL